jgi:hypothetical protein
MKDARWDFLNTVKSLIDEYNLEYLEAFHEEIHDDIVKLDNADEIIKLVEQAKIDLFNEVQQNRIKEKQLRREEKVKEPKKAEMRERVARLSEQLDKRRQIVKQAIYAVVAIYQTNMERCIRYGHPRGRSSCLDAKNAQY